MSSAIDAFLEKQAGIYKKFDDGREAVVKDGFSPDPALVERKGGYLIALRPSALVCRWSEHLWASRRTSLSGVVRYGPAQLHTTLSDYRIVAGFNPDADSDAEATLNGLADIASRAVSRISSPIDCSYEGATFNQTTVIAKGVPCSGFLDLASLIVEEANDYGLALRLPWGAHITLARASAHVTHRDAWEILGLLSENSMPEGMQKYTELVVGQLVPTPTSFEARFVRRFPLPA